MVEWGYELDTAEIQEVPRGVGTLRLAKPLSVAEVLQDP
jgi:hypothetical protein